MEENYEQIQVGKFIYENEVGLERMTIIRERDPDKVVMWQEKIDKVAQRITTYHGFVIEDSDDLTSSCEQAILAASEACPPNSSRRQRKLKSLLHELQRLLECRKKVTANLDKPDKPSSYGSGAVPGIASIDEWRI